MIKTTEQLMAEIQGEGRRPYPKNRRSRLLPAEPCKNAHRGCQGNTKEKFSGHGWCRNCYDRWRKHGDSWYHSPNVSRCVKGTCFMRGTPGHP
jgi:hypothetical protein